MLSTAFVQFYEHSQNETQVCEQTLSQAWCAGEKLSESRASDVRELCTTLLNAYLIQLLETGHLHADPHPGNLIRTPDGKICILDFGLMTEVCTALLRQHHDPISPPELSGKC